MKMVFERERERRDYREKVWSLGEPKQLQVGRAKEICADERKAFSETLWSTMTAVSLRISGTGQGKCLSSTLSLSQP